MIPPDRSGRVARALSAGLLALVSAVWLIFGEPGFFGRLNTIGFAFCHQIPARTPVFPGFSFPLCYRCGGLFFGLACGYAMLRRRRFSLRGLTNPAALIWIFLSFAFYALDGLKTFGRFPALSRLVPDLAVIRYASGICFGSALALVLAPIVHEVCADTASTDRVDLSSVGIFLLLAVMGGTILLLRSGFLVPIQLVFSVSMAFVPPILVSLLFFVAVSAADRIVHQGLNRLPTRERLLLGIALSALLTAGMILIRYRLTGGWMRAI